MLEQTLRCLLAEQSLPETEWCKLLCHVEFAINSTITESIGHSVFELVYGEQFKLPIDAIVGNQSGMSTVTNFIQHIQQFIQEAKDHLKRAQEY